MTVGAPERLNVSQYRALVAAGATASRKGGALRRRRETPEENLQIACFQWVDMMSAQHPILAWMVHVPNGGKRTKAEAGRLKAMGVKSGVLDVLLPRPYRGWPGLAIELKSAAGRLSRDQSAWLAAFKEDGCVTAVCRTLDEFIAAVTIYLNGR